MLLLLPSSRRSRDGRTLSWDNPQAGARPLVDPLPVVRLLQLPGGWPGLSTLPAANERGHRHVGDELLEHPRHPSRTLTPGLAGRAVSPDRGLVGLRFARIPAVGAGLDTRMSRRMALSFGVTVLPDPPYQRMIELLQLAEGHGFEYGWTYDSHVLWQQSTPTLALAAAATPGRVTKISDGRPTGRRQHRDLAGSGRPAQKDNSRPRASRASGASRPTATTSGWRASSARKSPSCAAGSPRTARPARRPANPSPPGSTASPTVASSTSPRYKSTSPATSGR
jgi:hypothetical protein